MSKRLSDAELAAIQRHVTDGLAYFACPSTGPEFDKEKTRLKMLDALLNHISASTERPTQMTDCRAQTVSRMLLEIVADGDRRGAAAQIQTSVRLRPLLEEAAAILASQPSGVSAEAAAIAMREAAEKKIRDHAFKPPRGPDEFLESELAEAWADEIAALPIQQSAMKENKNG